MPLLVKARRIAATQPSTYVHRSSIPSILTDSGCIPSQGRATAMSGFPLSPCFTQKEAGFSLPLSATPPQSVSNMDHEYGWVFFKVLVIPVEFAGHWQQQQIRLWNLQPSSTPCTWLGVHGKITWSPRASVSTFERMWSIYHIESWGLYECKVRDSDLAEGLQD